MKCQFASATTEVGKSMMYKETGAGLKDHHVNYSRVLSRVPLLHGNDAKEMEKSL